MERQPPQETEILRSAHGLFSYFCTASKQRFQDHRLFQDQLLRSIRTPNSISWYRDLLTLALFGESARLQVAVGRCRSFISSSRPRVAPPRARWMQLVCGIGDFVSLLREAPSELERYLPVSLLLFLLRRIGTKFFQVIVARLLVLI